MATIISPEKAKEIASKIIQGIGKKYCVPSVQQLVFELLANFEFPGVTRSYEQVWFRARICDSLNGFDNVKELLYAPNGSKKFGRASLPNQRILYAGWNERVAMEEVNANKGHFVQLIRLRVRAPFQFPCAVVGEYQSVFNSGSSVINSEIIQSFIHKVRDDNIGHFYSQVYIDSVLADIFRRKVVNHEDYMTSAVIADCVTSLGNGFIFPSVRTSRAVNLAVGAEEFDRYFEVIDCRLMEVLDYHGYGLFALKPHKYTCEMDNEGYFKWSSTAKVPMTRGKYGNALIPPDFPSWHL